jgi:iron complex transport system substrate-binding protein
MLFGKEYTDMLGRKVIINKAQSFVFLGPGALRLGTYLGLKDRIKGIERVELRQSLNQAPVYRLFLGEEFLKKIPIVGEGGPGKMPNLEALTVANPDVIFTSFFDKNQIEQIQSKTKIPVVALSYGLSYGGAGVKNLEDIKASLMLIGEIANEVNRAQKLVDFIILEEQELSKISLPKKSIYIGAIPYKGIQPITSTDANYPPFELLGLKNSLFENKQNLYGHQFVDFEALLSTNPEIIFLDTLSKTKIDQDYTANKALYNSLQAYQNGNVFWLLNFNNYSTNVENLILIAWQIASFLTDNIPLHVKAIEIYEAFYPNHGKELFEKLNHNLDRP